MIPILAVSIALVLVSAFVCGAYARWMKRHAIGQHVRDVGPAHQEKAGTPTAGGLVVAALWAGGVAVVGCFVPLGPSAPFVLASGLSMAAIGALDDLLSLRRRQSMGLTGWQKIALISLASAALYWIFRGDLATVVAIPFTAETVVLPSVALFLLTWMVFLSTTNAVNLTDGLDGLAAGVGGLVLLGLLLLRPSVEAAALLIPLIAALAGFLWQNAPPARLFLGDVGAFAVGGAVAGFALSSGTVFLLPLVAGVPVLETASDILQVASWKLRGKRVFRMAPLHHHFEAGPPQKSLFRAPQWPEQQVTIRFWIAQAIFVGLALIAGWRGRG
jgi:phospho-N-acetylmuramoyl-pentapeptide-transferase